MATVTLKSLKPERFTMAPPTKRTKEIVYQFKKKSEEDPYYYCEVPTKIVYKDDFGKEKELVTNMAEHLVQNVEGIELVEVVEDPVVQVPVVRKKAKGKKNE